MMFPAPTSALVQHANIQLLKKAYESFLGSQIVESEKGVAAVHGVAVKDLSRMSLMGKTTGSQAGTMLKILDSKKVEGKSPEARVLAASSESSDSQAQKPKQQAPPKKNLAEIFEESVPGPSEELQAAASAWQQDVAHSADDEDALFKNLKDCIPCQQWEFGEFTGAWDNLIDELTAGVDASWELLTSFEDIFDGNPVLDRLCSILNMFKNLCPQDLVAVAMMLGVYVQDLLEQMVVNIDGIVQDILGVLLKPFVGGLQSWLGQFQAYFMDQFECIMNVLATSLDLTDQAAREIESARTGKPPREPSPGSVSSADLVRKFRSEVREKEQELSSLVNVELPQLLRKGIDSLNKKLDGITAVVSEIVGLDFLASENSMSITDLLKRVATWISLIKTVLRLFKGNFNELCERDSIAQLIDEVNSRSPNAVITDVIEEKANANRRVDIDPGRPVPDPLAPGMARPSGQAPSERQRGQITFSLADCLKKPTATDAEMMSQWIGELS